MSDHCHGNGPDHCCYLGEAGVCIFLEEHTVEGRRWACQLRRRLGSWGAVHESSLWIEYVKPWLDKYGVADCGSWPPPGTTGGLCCFDTPVTIGGGSDGD